MINTVSNTLPPVASSNTSSTVQQTASSRNAFAQAMASAEQQANMVNSTLAPQTTQATSAVESASQTSDEQIKASINLWRSLMKNPSTKDEAPVATTPTPESTAAPVSATTPVAATPAPAVTGAEGLADVILQEALAKASSSSAPNESSASTEAKTVSEPTSALQETAIGSLNQDTAEASTSVDADSSPQQSALSDAINNTTNNASNATATTNTTTVSDIWREALASSNSTTALPTEAPTQAPLLEPEQPNPVTQAQAWQQDLNNPFTNTVQQTALDQLEKMIDYFKNQQQTS